MENFKQYETAVEVLQEVLRKKFVEYEKNYKELFMTYNTKERILQIGVYEKVKLTYKEHKLLICLSSNNTAKYEDVLKELAISMNDLRRLKQRLIIDTKRELIIMTVKNSGYRLLSEVYFE